MADATSGRVVRLEHVAGRMVLVDGNLVEVTDADMGRDVSEYLGLGPGDVVRFGGGPLPDGPPVAADWSNLFPPGARVVEARDP